MTDFAGNNVSQSIVIQNLYQNFLGIYHKCRLSGPHPRATESEDVGIEAQSAF